ncbi:TatD family hydrolase [Parasphaerochaeta coccoides]|uniref:Hydrolase, TatD family n=1 Tax=Parasphaerochaeta coccoides (strain ATCC BAA-1237 / DSM 17374 / SPN1) TaxID=760011 RepID=F4GLQ8_PARC1|nr:YchF/TatD family DNA exonuclease [Parasphaerochaeta coccoides]AEC02452.1 hydrolase, TatD family [Parasphaerochaeta coccoides DSM 17374]
MKLFDTHAHIGLIQEDRMAQLLAVQVAKTKGVEHIVSICNSIGDFDQVYGNLKMLPNVYHAVGVSPTEAGNPGLDWENKLVERMSWERVIAVGETGLDYYRNSGGRKTQVEMLLKHLDVARRFGKTVIIHNRDAGKDLLEILRDKLPTFGGILHCYSEDWSYAMQALDLPLYFSFAGNVTYRGVYNLHETVYNLPLERILIESEAPFMVPAAYKGKRNMPAYLIETAQAIADIKEMPLEEVAPILYENSLRAFHLDITA